MTLPNETEAGSAATEIGGGEGTAEEPPPVGHVTDKVDYFRVADDTSITLAKPRSGRLDLPVCSPAATRAPAHFWANRERAS
jgi:hypothetical protein